MEKRHQESNKLIKDADKRNMAFNKRRKGLIKKMIDIKDYCGQEIFMIIFDKDKQKLMEYRSSMDFDL